MAIETKRASGGAGVQRESGRKRNGVHYTPPALARFLACQVAAELTTETQCRVLDPACGDGELLHSFAEAADEAGMPAPVLVGVDRDERAINQARTRLADVRASEVIFHCRDFLQTEQTGAFDAVISNPPYVRTQVLGADEAQRLASKFSLTGRVDLYHAFAIAMTHELRAGGVLGLLCSNRFLLTKSGQSLRTTLLASYELDGVWDLGDTRLFDAAVLPAIVVARRKPSTPNDQCSFVRVYEAPPGSHAEHETEDLFAVLHAGEASGFVKSGDRVFDIERGTLAASDPSTPWRVKSPKNERWLETVLTRTAKRFGDLGHVRVGVKTTADPVFIRSRWDDLPEPEQPEGELLYPLLTHRVAAPWHAAGADGDQRYILYPHEVRDGRRQVVELDDYPRARAYLERHRARLESRSYIKKAGRRWYEIWVPQQPAAWAGPKLVWPDISDRPRFFLDHTGAIVNGDCYWLGCGTVAWEDTALALAVANSSFALWYYDACSGNRLYGNRRRFITQYVKDLPLPSVTPETGRHVAETVSQLCAGETANARAVEELDALVWELFGLKEPGRELQLELAVLN